MNAAELLPLIRDLYSKHPEMLTLEPWEMQHVLWSLGYSNEQLTQLTELTKNPLLVSKMKSLLNGRRAETHRKQIRRIP
jgi:hypothetical protein